MRLSSVVLTGYYFYRKFNTTIIRSAHTVYLCVLCGSQNKQQLFPYTPLTDWLYNQDVTL